VTDTDPVTAAYDRIAELWRHDRLALAKTFRERRFIDELIDPLPPKAAILDVGCGTGAPIAAYLAAKGFRVTGVDGSEQMISLARSAVPRARFVLGDMRRVVVSGPFDAIVAWDSVFHIPREEHAKVFARFHEWLKPAGRLLVSLGGSDAERITSQMHGQTFSYSGYAPEAALQIIGQAGFKVLRWEVDDPSSNGHIAVLATRSEAGLSTRPAPGASPGFANPVTPPSVD